jgi:hypothetical protein
MMGKIEGGGYGYEVAPPIQLYSYLAGAISLWVSLGRFDKALKTVMSYLLR